MATMKSLIGLINKIQRACTVLGDHGGEGMSLREALPTVAVVGGQEMEVANTKYVWWDLDCCQVPRGRDPYEVRWIIESALNKKFGPGPVTIFAIGNLNRILGRVLELISRAGIVIKHTSYGGLSITNDLVTWTYNHSPPAILMLISDREFHYDEALEIVKSDGYTILRTYVNQKPDSPTYASDVWLWKSLLTDTTTRQQELQGKCCETGEWYCMLCRRGGQSFTDFTTHCKTRQHLIWEWFTMVDRDPSVNVPTDKDLASLHARLMTHTVKQTKPRKHFGWHGQHKLKISILASSSSAFIFTFLIVITIASSYQMSPVSKFDPFVPLDTLKQKSHTEPGKVKLLSEPHKGPMLKFLSESCKNIGSFIAAIKQESKPRKHVGSHLKGGEHKLKESHWVPRNWDAGPSEEVQAFSSLDLST